MTLGLIVEFVRNTGEKGTQTFHKTIHISGFQFTDKTFDIKTSTVVRYRSIERHQKIHETVFHLFVRETKRIVTEPGIV